MVRHVTLDSELAAMVRDFRPTLGVDLGKVKEFDLEVRGRFLVADTLWSHVGLKGDWDRVKGCDTGLLVLRLETTPREVEEYGEDWHRAEIELARGLMDASLVLRPVDPEVESLVTSVDSALGPVS